MDSERLLAQALRAQAAGAAGYHPEPATTALPLAVQARPARRRLAAGWVLLTALIFGVLAGAAAGAVSTL